MVKIANFGVLDSASRVTKLATPTPVLREMVNEIKNSDDVKYEKDN